MWVAHAERDRAVAGNVAAMQARAAGLLDKVPRPAAALDAISAGAQPAPH